MKSNFQTILLGIFIAFFVFAVMIFSGLLPIGNKKAKTAPQGTIVLWGTFSNREMQEVLENFEGIDTNNLSIQYFEKTKENYQQDLIEAFASNEGPDLFFVTPDMILKNEKLGFITEIPFLSYPEKKFRDTYIDGADIFLTKTGITALPVLVDPIVLYYNKNLLSNEGIINIPKYWDELFDLNDKLTVKKDDGSITRSMIGLGRFDNITNAKDILATLLAQSGNPIIIREEDNNATSVFSSDSSESRVSAETSLKFFTEFSNPSYEAYSWNRSLPNSKELFIADKLAFYLGRASELFEIQSINPNLSFDVAQVFQARNDNTRTFGEIYGVAVSSRTTNSTAAFAVAGLFSSLTNSKNMSASFSLPPVSRQALSDKPVEDSFMYSFFNSAIISRSWLDPNSLLTDKIFNELVENILSNKLTIDQAVSKTQNQLDLLAR